MSFGDPTHAPFWEAAGRGELAVQRCAGCGAHQHYGRPHCIACGDDRLDWVVVPGRGTIHSVTVVHVKVHPDVEPPHAVAIVELDEGPRLLSRLTGEGALDAAIGARVEVAFEEREGAPPLPLFALA